MKKILMINLCSLGSTGKIMQGIGHMAKRCGHDVQMYVSTNANTLYQDSSMSEISKPMVKKLNVYLNVLTGFEGCFAIFDTLKLIRKISRYNPDVIHLHNLHYGYINLPMLFGYLKKKKVRVIWTLHDCWPFTGHCPHFVYEKCDKWKTGCHSCPRYKLYPKSIYDNSRFVWKWKKKWFSGLSDLTIIAPSGWLGDLVKQSFLKKYPVKVIYNGIDMSIFGPKPVNKAAGKFIILGVASSWNDRKGLDVFIELSKRLSEEYQIILVGTDDAVDKELPPDIVSVHRTNDQNELAEIYSSADVFVNPTREEVFGMVNVEALACGTPVVTFRTGGSPESIIEGVNGFVVDCDDVDGMEEAIIKICKSGDRMKNDCIESAKRFDMEDCFAEYIKLY